MQRVVDRDGQPKARKNFSVEAAKLPPAAVSASTEKIASNKTLAAAIDGVALARRNAH
jgi:hypothetical protein